MDSILPEFRTQEQIENSEDRSISRTRRQMREITQLNDFDLFATLTFDPKKHPKSDDYDYSTKKVIQWLNNQQRLHGAFRYLLVIERHKSGRIHFHALLGGFTGKKHEVPLASKQKHKKQKYALSDEYKAYKIDSWEQSNGFADAESIFNKTAAVSYLLKYIEKELDSPIQEKGRKRYYASKNMVKPIKRYNEELENLVKSGKYETKVDFWENSYVEQTTLIKRQ